MNDAEYNELRAVSWRRKLAPAEELQAQAYLAAHPEAQADWEEDLALTRYLQELPDPALSSNFTARVLQSLDVEQDRQTSAGLERRWGGWLRRLAPRMALAGLTVALALGGVYQYQSRQTRKEIAEDVGNFFKVANLPGPVPGPAVFEDFEAIQQLPVSFAVVDDDLLAALR